MSTLPVSLLYTLGSSSVDIVFFTASLRLNQFPPELPGCSPAVLEEAQHILHSLLVPLFEGAILGVRHVRSESGTKEEHERTTLLNLMGSFLHNVIKSLERVSRNQRFLFEHVQCRSLYHSST